MIVAIILGSKDHLGHAKQCAKILKDYSVSSELYIGSAHKGSEALLELLEMYKEKKESIVFITIAAHSNALSGFVASNTHHPVIACPAFEDKGDYMVNVHSSLDMPEETPSMTVVEPLNAAHAALRILSLVDKDLRKKVRSHIKIVKHSFSPKPIELDD